MAKSSAGSVGVGADVCRAQGLFVAVPSHLPQSAVERLAHLVRRQPERLVHQADVLVTGDGTVVVAVGEVEDRLADLADDRLRP